MRQYIGVIVKSFEISIKQLLIYRTTAILTILFSTLFIIAEILSVTVFFQFTDSIAGWGQSKVILLVATATLIQHMYNFLFIMQHEEFSYMILEGELDYILIKPLNTLFLSSIRIFDLPSLANMIIPIAMIRYIYQDFSIVWYQWVIYALLVILGVTQYYYISQLMVSLAFWVENSESFVAVPEYLFAFATKPRAIYPKYIQIMLGYGVPILMMTNLPIEVISGDETSILMIYSVAVTFVLKKLVDFQWSIGLRRYQSAN